MRNLKTILALLLIFAMVFTFAACGSKDDDGSGDSQDQEQSQDQDQGDNDDQVIDEDDEDADDFWDDEWDEDGWEDDEDVDGDGIKDDEQYDDEDDSSNQSDEVVLPTDLTGDYTGQFSSDTGTALNFIVAWAANKKSDGNYEVTCGFYVDCYSLFVSDRSGNVLSVETSGGTKEISFKTKDINKDQNTRDQLLVGSATFTLSEDELNKGVDVKATWDYRGTYSGTSLPTITAEGRIIKI